MNIHPLFVHFPIGVLSTYALLEIASWYMSGVRKQSWVRPAKIFLVTFGVLTAIPTMGTGDMAEELLKPNSDATRIVETHAMFAGMSVLIFGVIAASYVVRSLTAQTLRLPTLFKFILPLTSILNPLARALTETHLITVMVLVGMFVLITTGALGAAMVYGPTAEPIVTFVYNLFIGAK